MSKWWSAGLLAAIAILAFVAFPQSGGATVIIKTFRFSICVTGEKHPEGCKNAHADAHLVVPDDQMEDLDGEVGQGAAIMAPSRPGESAPGQSMHRGRRHQNDAAPQPDM